MKKSLPAIVAGLLAVLMILTGCSAAEKWLDEKFPEETVDPALTVDPFLASMPDREGRTYVVLLATQAQTNETLTSLSLLTFHTEEKTVHWLQLPPALFVHSAGTTLAGAYALSYSVESAKDSGTVESSTEAGIAAVRKLICDGFNIPVDYYVNFAPDQLKSFVKTIEGVPMDLPFPIGSISSGQVTLTADQVAEYLAYSEYADPTEGMLAARKLFAYSLWKQAGTVITTENLSLYSMELRGQMTTDIPFAGGEDIFFLRRFLQADPAELAITHISTQSVVYNGTQCRVMLKENARTQLNEQMEVYEEDLTPEQFDPNAVFSDYSNQLVQTVYTSSATLPALYTMTDLAEGKLVLER